MVTFDDLRNSLEQQRKRKAELKDLEDRLAAKQKVEILWAIENSPENHRARTEAERWGDSEKAYQTWKSRVDGFLEIATDYVSKLKAQSMEARDKYGNNHFNLRIPRKSYRFIFGDWQNVGKVSPLEFSFVDAFFSSEKVWGGTTI